jgi:hypothetical protein
LPPFARDQLDLSEEQEKAIRALEKDVKERLAKILTSSQIKKLENLRPPRPDGPPGKGPRRGQRPGGPGEKGGPPDDREERGRPPRPNDRGDRPPPPDGPDRDEPTQDQGVQQSAGGIQWFATWNSALAEAQRSGRPILLVSAAPHCAGVSGIW